MKLNGSDDQPPPPKPTPEIDQMKLQMLMQQIRDNQNLAAAIFGGAIAATLGAAAWAAVTVVTSWQLGILAIGIGFLVGFAVQKLGQGVDVVFGITGAVLALAGCLLGNYLAVCALLAEELGLDFFRVLNQMDMETAIDMMIETFSPTDLLFYGFAVYYGYRYSFRQLTEEEMASVARR